jgi:hypothetical protein
MAEITNPKLLPTGRFGCYRGFSLLFDNPGEHTLSPMAGQFRRIDCQVHADPGLALYAKLATSVEKIVLPALDPGISFSALPAYSYHVTVWDGFNDGNRKKVVERYQPDLADFLLGLPVSLHPGCKFTALPESSPLVGHWYVAFQFDRLSVWGNSVLVARLKPADDRSLEACSDIAEHRIQIYEKIESEFGLGGWRSGYAPHVSLGYFWNEPGARAAASQEDRWTEEFKHEIGSDLIRFDSVSLYGFLDMETYFKRMQEPSTET